MNASSQGPSHPTVSPCPNPARLPFTPMAAILPPEIAARFDRLRRAIYNHFRPANAIGQCFADSAAEEIWESIERICGQAALRDHPNSVTSLLDELLDHFIPLFAENPTIGRAQLAGLPREIATPIRRLNRYLKRR